MVVVLHVLLFQISCGVEVSFFLTVFVEHGLPRLLVILHDDSSPGSVLWVQVASLKCLEIDFYCLELNHFTQFESFSLLKLIHHL